MGLFVLRCCMLGWLLAAVSPAQAAAPLVQAEGQTVTLACDGAAATVAGNGNTISFTGSCAGLQLRGERNAVTVPLGADTRIDIEGNQNKVRFTAHAATTLRVSGTANTVVPVPGSAAPLAATAVLSGDGLDVVLDCAGKSVTLAGTRAHYRLLGSCVAVTVRGEANVVQAELAPAAQILVEGNGIVMTYHQAQGPAPATAVRGMGSSVTSEAVAAAASVPSAPNAPARAAMASVPVLMRDLEASVVEPGTLVKLPAAVFAGGAITPAGETQLERLAQLIGQINPSGLRLAARDPAAAAMVLAWLERAGLKKIATKTAPAGDAAAVDVLILR